MAVANPATGKGGDLDHANTNVHDKAALQRGASLFVNYCMGCHSVQFMRYQRLADDLGLTEEQVEEFLIMGDGEAGDYMLTAMDASDAEDWFGVTPPDLSLTARSRGSDWIYSFLRGYYLTDDGWNNTVLENPAMPHVLWDLQGIQRAVTETYTDDEGQERTRVVSLELDQEGRMSPRDFDKAMLDLTTFMEYVAEPAALQRERLGIWVLLFLGLLTFLAYLLYKEYWKDVK
ncbi:cytochrome c1 [Wenzhouxiangella sp. AB-CW3]|nr:cytochrome c1 [Wenzhouxiangella sp. AB-CW3]